MNFPKCEQGSKSVGKKATSIWKVTESPRCLEHLRRHSERPSFRGEDFCGTHWIWAQTTAPWMTFCALAGLLIWWRAQVNWNLVSPLPDLMILGRSLNLSNSVKWGHQSHVVLKWLWGSHEIMCFKWPDCSSRFLPNISHWSTTN